MKRNFKTKTKENILKNSLCFDGKPCFDVNFQNSHLASNSSCIFGSRFLTPRIEEVLPHVSSGKSQGFKHLYNTNFLTTLPQYKSDACRSHIPI